MKHSPVTVSAVSVIALALAAVGCGSKSETTSSSSASSSKSASASSVPATAAANQDYSKLLLDASDVSAPDDPFTAQAPTLNPSGQPGVATVFSNSAGSREIGDTILILPDPGAAATALKGATAALSSSVSGGNPQPAQIGSDSIFVAGTSPDGAKAVSVLLFTEGKAFTTLEFDSGVGDSVPTEAVLDIAGKQAQKIKSGLGG